MIDRAVIGAVLMVSIACVVCGCSRRPTYAEAVQTYQAEFVELNRLRAEQKTWVDRLGLLQDIRRDQEDVNDEELKKDAETIDRVNKVIDDLEKKIQTQNVRIGEAERAKEAAH